MKVTFIKHSGYSVETENYFLVFDYIGGELNIPENKKVVFFVSHSHGDHFNSNIFDLQGDFYIISDDVKIEPSNTIHLIGPDEEYSIKDLLIITHGSTDEGVSFYVKADGKGIIHSGDLNHWVWDTYTPEEHEEMKTWFRSEVDKFKNYEVDTVMMVVDPRMEDSYYFTAEYFLKTINAKNYFPMHMWDDFDISSRLYNKYFEKFSNKTIHIIEHDNQSFEI